MSNLQSGLLFLLCGPFVLALWVAFIHARRNTPGASLAPHPSAGLDPAVPRFSAEVIDVEAALREAATAVISPARVHRVRIDLAVTAAMTLHVDPGSLGIALQQTLLTAIHAAPGGQVLVTAVTLGSQLHIRVTDDGSGADQLNRETLTRGAEALIALQGGSIAVEARPGKGTTVSIRLPLPSTVGQEVCGLHCPDPAITAWVALAA